MLSAEKSGGQFFFMRESVGISDWWIVLNEHHKKQKKKTTNKKTNKQPPLPKKLNLKVHSRNWYSWMFCSFFFILPEIVSEFSGTHLFTVCQKAFLAFLEHFISCSKNLFIPFFRVLVRVIIHFCLFLMITTLHQHVLVIFFCFKIRSKITLLRSRESFSDLGNWQKS